MIKDLVLVEKDFLKGVHVVIITVMEFLTYERLKICECLEERGVPFLFFATDKTCDDKFMVEDD